MSKKNQLTSRFQDFYRLLVLILALGGFALISETFSLLDESKKMVVFSDNLRWRQNENKAQNSAQVSDEDLLHLGILHEHCVMNPNTALSWEFGSPGNQRANGTARNPEVVIRRDDGDLLEKLRQCPDVDIFLPENLHGNGYCEDAVVYAKYLNSRLLSKWILEIQMFDPNLGYEVDYFDLCPKTPMLFFNHYWEDVPLSPQWPKDKPIYLMPNIEMFELTAAHYWEVDVVLCKTKHCYHRVTKWYEQEGNPRNTTVLYTKHTSSDQALFARKRLGDESVTAKNFSSIKFTHTAGSSAWKGTRELLQCWVLTSGLPQLDVYINPKTFNRLFKPDFKTDLKRSQSPVNVHLGVVERLEFTKLTAEASFFICPSTYEGYGHYINQARASGAVVITTDLAPMNELITSNLTGLLIPVEARKHPGAMLGGAYKGTNGLKGVDGLYASFQGSDVCGVVRQVMNFTTEERAVLGSNARQAYLNDTKYFVNAMRELRTLR